MGFFYIYIIITQTRWAVLFAPAHLGEEPDGQPFNRTVLFVHLGNPCIIAGKKKNGILRSHTCHLALIRILRALYYGLSVNGTA